MSSSLDDHIRSVLDRIRVTVSGQLEADLTASTADILRAIADDHRQAILAASDRSAAETRLEAEQRLSVVRGELERAREESQRGAAFEIGGLERTLGELREELEAAQRNLDVAARARDALVAQLEHLERDQRDQIERTHRQAEEARLASDATARELGSLRTRLTQSERLTSAMRMLDEATSLGEILEHLVRSACQETGRTAVFLVNGEKLRGWRALGFEADDAIVGSDLAPAEAGVVGQAVRLRAGQRHRNGDTTLLPWFATTHGPRDAVAQPVQVGGSVIAVLYADAARTDKPEEPEWLDMIDAIAKHAGRVLEAMTVRQAAALWTPRPGARRSEQGGERPSVGAE